MRASPMRLVYSVTCLTGGAHSVASVARRPRWYSANLALAEAIVWASSAIRGRSFPGTVTYSSSYPTSV